MYSFCGVVFMQSLFSYYILLHIYLLQKTFNHVFGLALFFVRKLIQLIYLKKCVYYYTIIKAILNFFIIFIL